MAESIVSRGMTSSDRPPYDDAPRCLTCGRWLIDEEPCDHGGPRPPPDYGPDADEDHRPEDDGPC